MKSLESANTVKTAGSRCYDVVVGMSSSLSSVWNKVVVVVVLGPTSPCRHSCLNPADFSSAKTFGAKFKSASETRGTFKPCQFSYINVGVTVC
jgi:hypothetical protein